MPLTKKKVAIKSTTKPKPRSVPKSKAKKPRSVSLSPLSINHEELFLPEKQFINVYEQDPIIASKSRLTWLIIGIIMLVIISFWFWTLKISTQNTASDESDLNKITAEIDNMIKEFQGVVTESKEVINESTGQLDRAKEIEQIKNDVLSQIQINADSTNWPIHTSNLLGLSLKYPTNWFKQEKKDLLTLASYDLNSTTTPALFAKIVITKFTSNTKTTDLIKDQTNYSRSSEDLFIDLWPTEKFIANNPVNSDLAYILITRSSKYIYKLDVYADNQNIFAASINKILSTIDLL